MIDEEQQAGELPIMYDEYNPNDDQGDLPYIPSLNPGSAYKQPQTVMKPITEAYVDLDNMQQYSPRQKDTDRDVKSIYQQELNNGKKEPSYADANSKIQEMNSVLSQLNDIIGTTPNNQGRPSNAPTLAKQTQQQQQRPAIDTTIMTMKKTLEYLRNVNAWLPEPKKEYSQKLQLAAAPIIKALDAYMSIIEKMK